MSKTILLNQNWIFSKEGHDEPVTLPHTWNAIDGQDGGNDYYRGTCCYTTTMPQPTDPSTPAIFWMTMALKFGLPIIGWIITLIAMRSCPLSKEEMVNVQKRIAEKKAAAQSEFYKEQLQ